MIDQEVKEFIFRTWASNNVDRFPGPQPISLERKHLTYIAKEKYFVCEKTDGVRHFLVCFTDSQARKICGLVNRKMEFTLYSLTVPRDTLLDGELLDGVFIVHDAVCIKGENLMSEPLTTRLEKAREMIKFIVPTPKLTVQCKTMIPVHRVLEIVMDPKKMDGLIFTPCNEPIRMGTHRTMFKWKPIENITIDFWVSESAHLCIQNNGRMNAVQKCPGAPRDSILECYFSGEEWKPLKIREDKNHPNNKMTYERTMVNIKENIQFCELRRFFGKKD
jgi:hypothetical protein